MNRTLAITVAAVTGLLYFLISDAFLSPPDCAFYWAWGQALFERFTLDLRPAISELKIPLHYVWLTPAQRLANDWPPGTGFLLGPAVLAGKTAAHAVVIFFTLFALACWSGKNFLRQFVHDKPAGRFFPLIGLILGTPLFFYSFSGPFFSHNLSFVVVSLFLILWERTLFSLDPKKSLLLGLLLGWAILIRPQNGLLGLIFIINFLLVLRRPISDSLKKFFINIIAVIVASLVSLTPRFIAMNTMYGNPFVMPKLDEMHWISPAFKETLLSDYHGILPWTPVYALAFMGLLLGIIRKYPKPAEIESSSDNPIRWIFSGLLLVFGIQLYVNAANEVWWSGGSFGNRRMVDYSIVVAYGLYYLTAFTGRTVSILTKILIILCTLWTLLLFVAERRLIVPLDRYIEFYTADFWKNFLRIATEYDKTWLALTRGLWDNIPERLLYTVLLSGGVFLLLQNLHRLTLRRAMGILAGYTGVVIILTTIAAIRTPVVSLTGGRNPYRASSAILWDNYMELGEYHRYRQDWEKLGEVADKAIAIRPEQPGSLWYKCLSLYHNYQNEESLALARKVLEIQPQHPGANAVVKNLTESE